MPCEFDRDISEDSILTIRLISPLTLEEAREIRDALADVILREEPLRVLLDLTEADSLNLLGVGMNNFEEFLPDTLSYHTQHSRVALLKAGPAIKLALSFAGSYSDHEIIRDFTTEERALAWLRAVE